MLQKIASRARRLPDEEPAVPASERPATPTAANDADEVPAATPRRRRRWLRRLLLLVGPLLVLGIGGYVYFSGGRYVSTENAYVQADKVMVGAEVSGLISEVDVAANQHVAKGDVLFRIDDRPYRIALAEAEAKLAVVRDEITGLKSTYRQKEEELKLARTKADFAQKEYDRQSRLVANKVISTSTFDATSRDLETARQNVRVAEQEVAQIRAQLGGDPDMPIAQHARYREAKAARERAALDLERTVVRAPFAGVASHTPNVGQQVTGNSPLASPVMSIVADSGFWIDANFKETDLTHVRPGQSVSVQVDTYPGHTWHGTVASISQATGAEFSVIPAQNATGNWVKVVQRIPVRVALDTDAGDPPLRAGMSTSVEIDTGHRRALPQVLETALAWIDGVPTIHAAEADRSN